MLMQPFASYLSDSHPEMPAIAWHLLVNRRIQRNKTSCSVASLCIALNGLSSASCSGVVEKPLGEPDILETLTISDLRRKLAEGTGGATLEQIADMARETIGRMEHLKLSATAHHMDTPGKLQIENLKQDLADSGNGTSVIVANYHQGVATGRDLTHGHFAPVAPLGLDASEVCVIDPAMDGLPFVISAEHLCKAMATKDKTSGHNRGYLKIRLEKQ